MLSLIITILAYSIALICAIMSLSLIKSIDNVLIKTFVSDLVATVVIFLFSVIFSNASLYDPYWSVAPPLIIYAWLINASANSKQLGALLLLVTLLWSIRLTTNWARGWKGLVHEDWRYIQLKKKNPVLYPLINFAGIHLFPTVMVFLCLIPAYYTVNVTDASINLVSVIGLVLCLAGTLISLIADEQLRKFRKSEPVTACIQTGLWKNSRHPNYLGEIIFWAGIFVVAVGVDLSLYWTVIGSVLLTLMFIFISIPMMEKRNLEKRSCYRDVIRKIPMLVNFIK